MSSLATIAACLRQQGPCLKRDCVGLLQRLSLDASFSSYSKSPPRFLGSSRLVPDSVSRSLCTTGASDSTSKETDATTTESYPDYDVSYTGSFCTPHKRLKQASLLNTFAACVASPLVLLYAEMGFLGRVGLAVTLTGFGILTTGALHWFTKPYVHELNYDGKTKEIEIKSIDLLSRLRSHKFHISDVTFPTSLNPVVTFMAKGKPYFIEKNIFPDAELLDYLTPEDPALANTPKGKDEDDD